MSKLYSYIYYLLINSVAGSHICPNRLRKKIYNAFGHKVYGNVMAGCFLGAGPHGKLFLGKGSYINYKCFLDLGGNIIIGDNVAIGFCSIFINSSHQIGPSKLRAGEGGGQDVYIGNGCWIGANCTIMPGVRIGEGCVIGAGSLVIHDCEPNCIYYGRPAKLVKRLD